MRIKFSNSVQGYQKIVQTRLFSGEMSYKESESYKGYHLFLIQKSCIHFGIGYQKLAMAKNVYSKNKLAKAYS